MRRYGSYKLMNMIFGILPFFAAVCMTQMREDSNQAHLWLTIVCPMIILHNRMSQLIVISDAPWVWECCCNANYVQCVRIQVQDIRILTP